MSKLCLIISAQQSSCLVESTRRLKNVQLSKDWDFQSRRPRLLLGSASVRERSPTPTLMLSGTPASPHQVAVLSQRPRSVKEMAPNSLTTGSAPPPAGTLPI